MQMKYTRVIWVIGLVLFLRPSFGWGETEHHAQRCHIGPSAELVVSSIPTLRVGTGPDLTCMLRPRISWRLGIDVMVGVLPKPKLEGGLSIFSSLEGKLRGHRNEWLGIGVLAVKMLDTPKFEVGGGPVFRFKPWGGPMVGFILMVETEIPLGLSGEKPGEEQLPLILKGGFQVSL